MWKKPRNSSWFVSFCLESFRKYELWFWGIAIFLLLLVCLAHLDTLCSSFMSKHKIFVPFLCKWRAPLDLTLYLLSMQKCLHTWAYSSRISIVLSLFLSVSFEPVKTILPGIIIIIIVIIIIILNCYCNYNSETLLYGYVIIMDSLLCPWKKKCLTFSLNSTRLIRTSCQYRHFLWPPQCSY